MMVVQPKDDAAEQFSKERILPMIKATPALRRLISVNRKKAGRSGRDERYVDKEPENALTFLRFQGGFLALTSAGSPDKLARWPIGTIPFDAMGTYEALQTGDSLTIGDERLG